MKKPSVDDILLAVEWLDEYDKESEKHSRIINVSRWLEEQARLMDIRKMSKDNKVSYRELKKRFKS